MAALDAVAPNRATLALMDRIFTRVLAPAHDSCDDVYTPAARLAAFVRAHWLRMPAYLLIPHLFLKVFVSPHLDTRASKAASRGFRRAYNFRVFQSSIVQEPTMTPLDRIRDQVTNNSIVLSIKGPPPVSPGGFSSRAAQVLQACGVKDFLR